MGEDTYTLTVGIHGSSRPLVIGPMAADQLADILTDYRIGKTRVIKGIDVTRAHVAYMTHGKVEG